MSVWVERLMPGWRCCRLCRRRFWSVGVIRYGGSGRWWTRCWGMLDGGLGAVCPSRGRPSVPFEMLLKASVLVALCSVRWERLNFDMLFRWFLGLRIGERGFDVSMFLKNRRRLLGHDVADRFFAAVVDQAKL